jgi:hypothetical protein
MSQGPPRGFGICANTTIVIGELIPAILDDLTVQFDDIGVLWVRVRRVEYLGTYLFSKLIRRPSIQTINFLPFTPDGAPLH